MLVDECSATTPKALLRKRYAAAEATARMSWVRLVAMDQENLLETVVLCILATSVREVMTIEE